MKGHQGMTSDDAAAPGDGGSGGKIGSLPFDTSKAHQARMYDYLLGGKDNYAADREAAEAAIQVWPDMASSARTNRAFLGRAVRYLAGEAGIRQFLDIGTGIPTAGNTHQVAQAIAPESRVVYVDYGPVVLARALLASSEAGATDYVHAGLRDTRAVLGKAALLPGFTKPAPVTLVAVLHALPDGDDPHAVVARLLGAVPSGSCLAVSRRGSGLIPARTLREVKDTGARTSQQRYARRSRGQAARFFAGTGLAGPGLARAEERRPEPGTGAARKSFIWPAAGRKP
jgi:hypothetical protein